MRTDHADDSCQRPKNLFDAGRSKRVLPEGFKKTDKVPPVEVFTNTDAHLGIPGRPLPREGHRR